MRSRIARTVEGDCPPRDLAALTRRLQDIAERITSLDLAAKQEGAEGAISSTPDEEFDASAL
jgi:hypothetical protein